jgi:hypothetical protein
MTEAEWLVCIDPSQMLDHLQGRDCQRQLSRFAVACCRRIWHLLDAQEFRNAVELCERFLEGRVSKAEMADAAQAARAVALRTVRCWYGPTGHPLDAFPVSARHPVVLTVQAVAEAKSMGWIAWVTTRAAYIAERAARGEFRVGVASSSPVHQPKPEDGNQAQLLRCIFENPFRPASREDSWRTRPVFGIARATYEARMLPSGELEPDRLGILGDALEDTGCADPEMLAHLRGPGPHVRGCWVLDLLLGKS